jgi:hypothetical protein
VSAGRVAAALAGLGVVAGLAAFVLWPEPESTGWRRHILETAYRPVHDDPEFVRRAEGMTPPELDRLVAETRVRGLLRLEDETLIRRAELYAGALEAAKEPICAILARGASPEGGTNVGVLLVNELDAEPLREWADISALAILAELHRLPAIRPSGVEASGALDAVLAVLPAADQDRLAAALADPFGVTDAEICWAGRTLYRSLRMLPPVFRATLARVLAAG